MTTVRDIVSDALWIASIVALGGQPKAAEMTFGVNALNDMLAAWAIDGLDLEQVTLVESDTPTFPESFVRGVKYNLAVDMASGPFRAEITSNVQLVAAEQKVLIRDKLFEIEDIEFANGEPGLRRITVLG